MRLILVSYPRSGYHFLRYCVQQITGEELFHRHDFHVNSKNERRAGYTDDISGTETRIVLLLRNYRECIPRHLGRQGKTFGKGGSIRYANNVVRFDRFPGHKLVMYYEDMISDLRAAIQQVLAFWELPYNNNTFEEFFQHEEEHRLASQKLYRAAGNECRTDGESSNVHSTEFTEQEIARYDLNMADLVGISTFGRYLSKFI